MIKVGFIGSESMGSMLVDSLLASGKVSSSEIIVSGGSNGISKPHREEVTYTQDKKNVIQSAKYIFLCTEPSETEMVLREIQDSVSPDTNIISTAFSGSIDHMESAVNCKITRLAPTMISENGKRVSVISHSKKVEDEEAKYIESLLCETCNARVYKAKHF